MTRVLIGLVVSLGLSLPSVAPGATLSQYFRYLSSDDEKVRFGAALTLVYAKQPNLAPTLASEIKKGFFADSKRASAAAEFVLLKLNGENPMQGPPPVGKSPNLFVISVDTLRSDHLGCYGYSRDTSPHIDALAARGALFRNAISPSSWTLPAHMSLFTSLYPSYHKLDHGGRLGSVRLDESEVMLAEILKGAGYATAGFVAHPFLSGEWGFDRGFDLYRRFSTRADLQADRAQLWLEWHRFHASRGLAAPNFFLFLHFIDPHETYSAPSPYGEKYFPDYRGPRRPTDKFVTLYSEKDFETPEDYRYALALYDGEINFVDANLGRVLRTLEQSGWADSTLVILTSDHGEEFKEHGSMGHKGTLYSEQLKVPLILAYPRGIQPAQTIDRQVSLLDVLPTVMELVGQQPLAKLQGTSLRPYIEWTDPARGTRTPPGERYIFAELGPLGFEWERPFYRKALRSGRYKLIYNYLEDGSVTKELYELPHDPNEKTDFYQLKQAEEEVRTLESKLAAFMREGTAYNKEFRIKNRIQIDTDTEKRLKALGYIE